MGLEDLDKLDAQYDGVEPAKAGQDFTPIPEDTRCKVVVQNQKAAIVGQKQTPVCKVTFEVVTPAEYAPKRIWHDFWLTEGNLKYLKRDLGHLGWVGRPSQLLNDTDTSLMGLGAEVTVGIETYEVRDAQTGMAVPKVKNIIKFFNEAYRHVWPGGAPPAKPAPKPAPAGAAAPPPGADDGIPF